MLCARLRIPAVSVKRRVDTALGDGSCPRIPIIFRVRETARMRCRRSVSWRYFAGLLETVIGTVGTALETVLETVVNSVQTVNFYIDCFKMISIQKVYGL